MCQTVNVERYKDNNRSDVSISLRNKWVRTAHLIFSHQWVSTKNIKINELISCQPTYHT